MPDIGPKGWKLLISALIIPVFGLPGGFAEGAFGQVLQPAIGATIGYQSGVIPDLMAATVLAALFAANLFMLGLLRFRYQVIVVWVELGIVFLLFFASFDLSYPFIYKKLYYLIAWGASMTIFLSLASIVLACILAFVAALARLSKNGLAFGVATFYISFFRGTPLLLQVFLIYIGLPQIGWTIDAIPAGILALTLCYGAYLAEIFRAGIQSVERGQWEAATAMGLHRGLVLWLVVLPQAIKTVIPAIGNQFIAMLKDSSLVSVLGVWELMFLARTLGRSEFRHLEMLITAALVYWMISGVFEVIQARIEARYDTGDHE